MPAGHLYRNHSQEKIMFIDFEDFIQVTVLLTMGAGCVYVLGIMAGVIMFA